MRVRRIPEHLLERPATPLDPKLADLVERHPGEVVDALEPLLSQGRIQRIERVIDSRLRSLVLVLDHLHDPHNGAAILRSAEAFGLLEIHSIQPSGSWNLSRRVTQGCHKWLDVVVHKTADDCAGHLAERGYILLVASETANLEISEVSDDQPVALCLGSEHFGVTDSLRRHCQGQIGIPMLGFTQSLNVSVAAAVLISRLAAGRRRGLEKEDRAKLKARYYAQSVKGALDVLELQEIP